LYPELAHFPATGDYGLDQPLHLKEAVFSIFIPLTSTLDSLFHSYSAFWYMDGGVTQHMVFISKDTKITTSCLVTNTTSLTQGSLQSLRFGLDLVDRFNK